MGLYEGIKEVAKVIQKADNIELYSKLLDLGEQALEMQAEIASLREENARLKKEKELDDDIVFHRVEKSDSLSQEYPYITLKSDTEGIRYCAICWGKSHKLIPLYNEVGCVVCHQGYHN